MAVKEKVVAAAAAALTRVMLPAGNRRDFDEIPQGAREKLQFVWLDLSTMRLPKPWKEQSRGHGRPVKVAEPRDQPSLRLVNQRLSGTRIGANAQRQKRRFSIQPSINVSRATPPG